MNNMTYSLVYHFVPNSTERASFVKTARDVAKMYQAALIREPNGDITLAGAVAEEVAPMLVATGLSPYMEWPRDIVTCDIQTPLPLLAVGMEDGWEIFVGEHVFIGFVTAADEAVRILERAGSYYTRQEKFETLPHFVQRIGLDAFRREVLGVEQAAPTVVAAAPAELFDDWSMATDIRPPRPNAPVLHYGDFVRPEDNIMEIITVYPEMGPLLMEYGMHCVGCFVSYDETLWEATQVHGMDVFELLGEMNEYLADKLGKELIGGETKLQDLLTMYPQTLAVLQEYGIAMPEDMDTNLKTLTAAEQVSLQDVLEQMHRVLRKE